jgi:hypothetical protein
MLKVLRAITILLTLGLFTTAFAACEPMVQSYTTEFMEELQEKVTLTPEQQDAMEGIMQSGINEREDIINSYQGQKGLKVKRQMRTELQSANEQTRSEVQQVLDDEQYQAFLEVQEKNQEKVRERINRDF